MVDNVIWDGSDHFSIVLNVQKFELRASPVLNTDKSFRYEAKWIHNESFPDTLIDFWNKAKAKCQDHWISVIQERGERLKAWSNQAYCIISRRLWWLKKCLVRVRKMV